MTSTLTSSGSAHRDRLLIVNADDLGLAPGVTRGILQLSRAGAVTASSVLANTPDSTEALATAREARLDVGVHLNLCAGGPLSPPESVPSLLDAHGRFCRASEIAWRLVRSQLRLDEVEEEWSRQIESVLASGLQPSHLDSHCHLHSWPRLYPLTIHLARRYGIHGVRRALAGYIIPVLSLPMLRRLTRYSRHSGDGVYQPGHFTVLSVAGFECTPRSLEALLRALPSGVTELVCHPGYVDDELRRIDPLTTARERELELLSSSFFRDILAHEGIGHVSWADACELQ